MGVEAAFRPEVQLRMMMPMPMGNPMRLPAHVAGSMSRMQGLLQAAQPNIQSAFAAHWLAARQAGAAPGFANLTQHMVMGLYGTTALSGLLRYALSSRATPEVVGGIIDQVNLIQRSYEGAVQALEELLQNEEARGNEGVQFMSRSLRPLDRVYQNLSESGRAVVENVRWTPSGQVPGFPVERAVIGGAEPRLQQPQQNVPPEGPMFDAGPEAQPEAGPESE